MKIKYDRVHAARAYFTPRVPLHTINSSMLILPYCTSSVRVYICNPTDIATLQGALGML